ncbi:MAG: PIG-L family deacetylase, partial [Phycisphaerales bacterium]
MTPRRFLASASQETPVNILVVGAHPDDQELGMGGTIARLAADGHRVHLLDMTNGEPTPHGTPEIRARESARAAEILGVTRECLGLPNREVVHSVEKAHIAHVPQSIFLSATTIAENIAFG